MQKHSQIYTDIGEARQELFEKLAEANQLYAGGGNAKDAYQSWTDTLHSIWGFLLTLEPPGDELSPLIGLTGALADLNQGFQPEPLTKRKVKNRPPTSHRDRANLAVASAAIDFYVMEKMSLSGAADKVFRAMLKHNLISSSKNSKSLIYFRKKIYERNDPTIIEIYETTKRSAAGDVDLEGRRGDTVLSVLIKSI